MTVYLWAKAAFLAAAFLALTGCHHQMLLRTSIVRSNFIFAATVQQVGSSGVPDFFRARRETLTVHVTRAFTAEFQEFVGQTVTIRLLADSPVKTRSVHGGEDLIFLANPLFYGDTLAVEAEARKPSATLEQQVSERPELLLADRVRSAEVIVYGTVEALENLPPTKQVSDFEHDPQWVKATVNIRNVIRGGDRKQIDVFFPASRDLVWYTAPRFRVRQSGTWLLHRTALGGGRKEAAFVALHPLDFLEGNTPAERVRLLARTNPYAASGTKPEGLR
jgi:hypothetical protein